MMQPTALVGDVVSRLAAYSLRLTQTEGNSEENSRTTCLFYKHATGKQHIMLFFPLQMFARIAS